MLNNRGKCHYMLGNYDGSLADFSEAIRIDPKHFVAFNNRALTRIAQEQYDQALQDVDQALKLNPKYPEALLNRGVIHESMNKSELAVGDYTAAIEIDEKYAPAWGNRAVSYRSLGRDRDAVADLRKAMQLSPTNFELVNDLAFTLATAKDEQIRNGLEAVALAEQAISMSEEQHWNTLDTLAVAKAAVGDFEGAAQALDQAMELAPESEQESLRVHQQRIAAKQPVFE